MPFDMREIYEMDDAGLMPPVRPPSIDEPFLDTQFGYEDMIGAPQPELQTLVPPKGPGIRQRLMGAIPGILNAGLIAAGTPNIAYGGPTDTARAIFSGMQGAQNIDATRQAQQMEQMRRRAETEATIQYRQAQAAAAEAAKQKALREERFINVGGAVFDKHTQKYLSPKEALFAQDFDRWRKQAIEIGLKPNTPEYQHYSSTGKLPDWYGKPETAKTPPKPTEEELAGQRKKTAAELGLKPGSPEYNVYVATGKFPTGYGAPPKQTGGMTPYQQAQLGRANEKDAKATEEKKREGLQKLEEAEYGEPGNEKRPGLHLVREQAGRELSAASKANDPAAYQAAADKLNAANRNLRNIYRQKLMLGVITQEQYQAMVANLQDARPLGSATPAPKPAATQGAPAAQPQSRAPLGNFQRQRRPLESFRR